MRLVNSSELAEWKAQWRRAFDKNFNGERPAPEFDWFAVDADRHIAVFNSGGELLIPEQVFCDYVAFEELSAFFLLHESYYSVADWNVDQYAAKGLYWYDLPSGGAVDASMYVRRECPRFPEPLKRMPARCMKYLERIAFGFRFYDASSVRVTDSFKCR